MEVNEASNCFREQEIIAAEDELFNRRERVPRYRLEYPEIPGLPLW